MKKLYFSRHAKKQMKWRGVTQNDVRDTVLYPDELKTLEIKNRKAALKRINKKLLKVVYIEEKNRIVIITALYKSI